jgi:hypothetical protein
VGNVGSTTFAYVIAYLLPGLVASVGIGLLLEPAGRVFEVVIDDKNLGLGLMGALGALTVGLLLNLFRVILFEEWLTSEDRIAAEDHAEMTKDEDVYRGYRVILDEVYRYHQFWGGMLLALPLLAFGLVARGNPSFGDLSDVVVIAALVLTEVALAWATRSSYTRYLERVRSLLGSG